MTVHDAHSSRAPLTRGHSEALGVVMPAYNEGTCVLRALEALRLAAEEADWPLRTVIVDDGSDDPASVQALDEAASREGVELVRQDNAGRFAARASGLARVDTECVLLLDARVEVDPQALRRLRQAAAEGMAVWNFDVTPASTDLTSAFWTGITKVWWRDYFRDRRLVSFGVDAFDRYPKGTGAFFAPTSVLREALGSFESLFTDARLASDDTRLLRAVAARHDIHLSPDITCRHQAKSGARQWSRQCYYRGTTFVDGYVGSSRRARKLLAGGALALAAGGSLVAFMPRTTASTAAAGCLAAGALTRWSGGTRHEALAVAVLSPAFGALFGAGVFRGLLMATGSRA